ncbi:septation ring formation regulator EzrA [Peribacillus asahii]|uniref:septation ring formation regulator EzrA n=1 Tax=Peribacillus asahii TaxID=228899 RepID=UPI00207958B2|nr:septation ring formation regulator EzrA [Peribacillus asahii]USK59100.1 septation ring formation regulator EzrA [Peribacillus asahii]
MMEYILGIVILLLVFIIGGYFFKRRYFQEIDRLETWKLNIMNRPVLEELSKVKRLNMNGETEELFENWRREWDVIITVRMPEVEELLFDAEEYVDKYRFKRSKDVQRQISAKLNEIEESIKSILSELHELVGSEEKNRFEVAEMQETYRQLKKSLLAHRHNYGKAVSKLEETLEEVTTVLKSYEEETENGNYLNARELVLSVKAKLDRLASRMEKLPALLLESGSSLPAQIAELKEGYQDMVDQGYLLNHIEFTEEVTRLETELDSYKEQLENAEVEVVEQGMNDLRDRLNILYDLLEKEVLSKQYVQKNHEKLAETLANVEYEHEKLEEEMFIVQQSYQLTNSELEAQTKMIKQIQQIAKRYELLGLKIQDNDTASSLISEEMQAVDEQLKALMEEQQVFAGKLQALRKDELDAKESLADLKHKMLETSRMISKSNIPGLPEEFKTIIENAKDSIDHVQRKLEEKPLDVAAVYLFLEQAVANTNKVHESAQSLIEHMYLAEKVIQYGNRFRSSNAFMADSLKEAEKRFHSFDYQAALETAAAAIEKVEPGSMQRLEANIEEVIS